MTTDTIQSFARMLIIEAGSKIRASLDGDIWISSKSNVNDLVTNIDQDIEKFFIQRIKESYPTHRVMGEEGFGDSVESLEGVVWILDPIDGTMNFIHQKRNFAISLGIYMDGKPAFGFVFDVMLEELYEAEKGQGAYLNGKPIPPLEEAHLSEALVGMNASWSIPNKRIEHDGMIQLVRDVRGIRSYGSAALETVYVATGRLDAYMSMRLNPWDIAGGRIIAEEVGAVVTNLRGNELTMVDKDTFFIANKSIHRQIIEKYIRLK
ncbi:inositol monophosphatase family protein [Paenisporosarcina cavernae]|uniref:inositol-phosphate phosphatase n=1 Tax=Paenisporosarcina cavernae TaxID=2320858 RepID=A0A385YRJ5_9BACL|nr:inositol monophosphatase family protein [Paenisporosarcina cavernae]AYC29114.1 inositol monophosphatase family protein [Paenisporosarcina cavernae]